MVIGIIGSSLAGLIAGEKLAKAGHDVTIIEKQRELGGRLATFKKDDAIFDYGISSVISSGKLFTSFMEELKQEGRIKEWTRDFPLFDGIHLHEINPNRPQNRYHVSEQGVNTIADYLSRWVDIKSEEQAGGLTHIGANRSKKRAWMINLTDVSVFECDAVILATPAPQAYGILQITQDETPSRRIIRHIDEVSYYPCYSLMAVYDNEIIPEWKGIECENSKLKWIGNESSKLENPSTMNVVIRSSAEFAQTHFGKPDEEIIDLLTEEASEITGEKLLNPQWTKLHFWKYFEAVNPMEDFFLEMEMDEAPLALVGDYLGGTSVEDAYLSGYKLAEYWVQKFS